MQRRDFLKMAGLAAASSRLLGQEPQSFLAPTDGPDIAKTEFTLRIAPVTVELAPNRIISTIGYNGTSPGPLLRMKEGVPVTVNVVNDTDVPEVVHFHGLLIPADVDGSEEEGTPVVPPHGKRSYQFTPTPAGTRWYHTHTMSMDDLHRGSYTGMFGFLVIEGANNPGRFDQEHYLALRDWEPYFTNQAMDTDDLDPMGAQPEKPAVLDTRPAGHGGSGRYFFHQRQSARRRRADPRETRRTRDVSFSECQRDREPASGAARPQIQRDRAGRKSRANAGGRGRVDAGAGRAHRCLGGDESARGLDSGRARGSGTRRGPGHCHRIRQSAPHAAVGARRPNPFGTTRSSASRHRSQRPTEKLDMVFEKVPRGAGKFNSFTVNGKPYPHDQEFLLKQGTRYRLTFHNRTDDCASAAPASPPTRDRRDLWQADFGRDQGHGRGAYLRARQRGLHRRPAGTDVVSLPYPSSTWITASRRCCATRKIRCVPASAMRETPAE